ncbi:MAG TPA: VOC family protein [Opitutaceae bacterium]|nr:VOC family protein [Opitutaceae bacterium]
MSLSSARRQPADFFLGIVTARFYETWDFYTAILGFSTLSENNTRVQLQHPGGAQLSLLEHEVDGNPSELISATDGRGFWLNLEVCDLDAEFDRIRSAGAPIVSPPVAQNRGARHFMTRDPNGILIYVSERLHAVEDLESESLSYQTCGPMVLLTGV